MRPSVALAVLVLVSGCSHTAADPPPPAGPFLTDPQDASFDGPYDILETYLHELNGSFVVTVHFRDFRTADGNFTLPKVEVRADLERDGRRAWYYAGNKANLSKPPPHVSYVMGRYDGDERTELAEICAEHTSSAPEPPFLVRVEFPNEHTSLDEGRATLHRLRVDSADFEGHAFDTANVEKRVALRGGPNPHETCPLLAERPQ